MGGGGIASSSPHLFSMRSHKEAQREMDVAGETMVPVSSGRRSSDHGQPEGAPCTSATEGSSQLWVGGDYSGRDGLHRRGVSGGKKKKNLFYMILQRKLGHLFTLG